MSRGLGDVYKRQMYSSMAKIIDSTIAVMSKTGETFEETDKQISMAIKSI